MIENKRIVRIGRLDTVGHVVTEFGRVYRLARRGEIDMGTEVVGLGLVVAAVY